MRLVHMVRAEHVEPRTKVVGADNRISVIYMTTRHDKDRSVEIDFIRVRNGIQSLSHDCLGFEDKLAVVFD